MFKFETVVCLVMIAAYLPAVHAQNNAAGNQRHTNEQYFDLKQQHSDKGCDDPKKRKTNLNACLRIERQQGGATPATTGESCQEAESKFKKAAGKFSSACGSAGLGQDDPKENEGAIGCSWSINRCKCLKKPTEDETKTYQCDQLKGGRSASGSGMIDIGAAEKRMEACPHEEPDDTERYEKQLEKSQEAVKKAKEKLPTLLDKGSEADDKANTAQNDAARRAAEAQKELGQEMKEIRKQREGEEQQAVQEMSSMREKMDQIDAQIRGLDLEKVNAEVKFGDMKVDLELQCHTTASTKVAGLQAAKMAEIRSGKPSGDFTKVMASVGVSSRAAWEKVAGRYYRQCITSRPHRELKSRAQSAYESSLRGFDTAINSLRQQRRRTEEGLSQVMSQKGCNGPQPQANGSTSETKMCRSLRTAQDAMAQAQADHGNKQAVIQQELATAARQLANKKNSLSAQYREAAQEIVDEERRLNNLRQYLDLKRKKANGGTSKKTTEALYDSYGDLTAAADIVMSCTEVANSTVEKARAFLTSIGQPPVEIPESLDDKDKEKENPRPAPTTPDPDRRSSGELQNGIRDRGTSED